MSTDDEPFDIVDKTTGRTVRVRMEKRFIPIQNQRAETFGELKTLNGRLVYKMTDGTFKIDGDMGVYVQDDQGGF
jgi:hypothetical protein